MGYLEEFQTQINNRDFSKFLLLWEEYCANDIVEADELTQLLQMIKSSDFAKPFGRLIETVLPLWEMIKEPKDNWKVFSLLIDLQNTNSPLLADLAFDALKGKYGSKPFFNERIRLVGLRSRDNFQGAISNFDLLAHMQKGNFVFHTSGWGTGEIIEVSPVREQVTIDFENVSGHKHLTFTNSFKSLIPLEEENFLVQRFAEPDKLEKKAKEDPVSVIKMLLRDLGPMNAAEIRDELIDLVIPEKDWVKWWQSARGRIKKDMMIETPSALKDPFKLRKSEISQEERLQNAIQNKTEINDIIQTSYNFVRDLPNVRKNQEVKNSLKEKLIELLSSPLLTQEQELQIYILLETMFAHQIEGKTSQNLVRVIKDVESVIHGIDILAFKKRVMVLVRELRDDWVEIFLSLLFSIQQSPLRDYLLKELNQPETRAKLLEKLQGLLEKPMQNPDMLVWYFQKIVGKDKDNLPFNDKAGQCLFFESFLILYSFIESKPEYRELVKKMYALISGKRYAVVRSILEGTDLEFIKEFLLLVSKCQTLSDHDMKILRSLAEVVHPSIASPKKTKGAHHADSHTLWTTEEGYLRIQDRIKHLGTIEIVENAREIEAARALGDLRENSEYKFALEKRSRLQGELKTLSDELGRARILTKDDIHPEEVGIGNVVDITDSRGKTVQYTILGPWDANPQEHVLSFQSKFVQAMAGCREGDTFRFKDEEYTVGAIKSFFDA